MKDEDGRVLVEQANVQGRWQGFFYKLFNGDGVDVSQYTEPLDQEEQQNHISGQPIAKEEVKEALMNMKSGKAVGPDSIPVEV